VNSESRPRKLGRAIHLVFNPPEKGSLFQRSADRGESGAELTTYTVNSRDDRNRDTGGDQAVFNGGCARFGADELFQNALQLCLRGSCVGVAQQL
jgi:hypothetical protein